MKPVSYRLPSDSVPGLPDPALRSPGVLPGSHIEGMPLADLPLQPSPLLIIDYTYDALHRLTSAAYSDGRNFGYTYDAAGNVLELEQNLGPGTVITTYTYDAANQLDTAQQGSHFVGNNTSQRKSYTGVNTGPVKISSTNGVPFIPSARVIYKIGGVDTSYSEMMALPDSQLDTTFWFPWYNNIGLDTQLRFANTTSTQATVHVYIGGTEMTGSPFTLAPGESMLKSFPAIDAGPVKIVSNVPIVASEWMIYKVNNVYTSYSEMMGLPDSQLDTTFWFPWYNNVDLDTQLRFANVSGSEATVHVYIGGTEMAGSPFTLAAGASVRKSFAGINGGPAKIVSDVPIVAAERVVYYVDNVQTSYAEMMGLPDSQLNTIYWFPSYNNVDLDSQLRIGNVSSSTTTVRLYVAGVELTSGCTPYNSPIPLAAGASVRVSCSGVNNGPVKVVSDVPIVAAERIIYKVNNVFTSYVEMMGFPDSELDTIYWMPRYNNVDPLNTELILAVGGSTSSGGEGFTGMSSQLSEVLEGGSSLEIESASETESTFDPYEITVEDGSPFWQGLIPGASQDSLVTFTNLHTPVGEQHSNGVWGEDSIQVLYDTPNERIQIWTYSAEDGWVQRGEDIPVTFADGDVLRARALEDGTVEIYHNGALLIQQGAMGSKAPKGSWFARFVSYFLPAPLAQASDTHTPTATQTATPIETPTATLSLTASTTPTAIDTPAVTSTPSPTGTLTPGTSTALATLSPTGTMSPSHTPTATQTPVGPITIEYVYDPLNRLTEANYSNNDYYHYTYDAVGNRKTQQSLVSGVLTNDAYNYDIANRLTDVNGVLYPWDDNGNLRNDGVNTYGYDSANRLKTLTGPSVNAAYSYNGLGDRLQETLNGQTTTFIMDLNTDLTQALSDGTNTYIYGVDRIAQTQGGTTEYFLDDALGSVRQMTSASGTVTYASAYDPYGVTAQTYGASQTAYGFTGEFIDSYIKLIYLRSRWYDPASGRFPTKDSWQGDYNRPLSLNRWNYVEANPVNYTDPSGLASSAYSRLLEIRDEVAPNGAEALFRSFEDFELYTKWGNEAGRTSRARLEWLLKVTTGAPDPLTNAIAPVVLVNFAVDFGSDCGFAVEFRDSGFYGLWGKDPQDSNQVGHFLTAVNMTYYWELVHKSNAHPDSMAAHSRWALYPIIGHEQMSDDPPYNVAIQPSKPTTWDFILWDQAVEFDSKGQYQWRDDALWAILNFPANIPMGGVDRRRVGNSLQDLRLSLKGYRFAHWVWDNPTTHPAQAGRWLSLNRQHIPDQKKFGGADR